MLQEEKPCRRIGEEPLPRQPGPGGRTPVGRTHQGDKPSHPRGGGECNIDFTLLWDKGREAAGNGSGPSEDEIHLETSKGRVFAARCRLSSSCHQR